MNRQQLKNDPKLNELFAIINPSKSTKNSYFNAFIHYTTFTDKTPSELIEDGNADIRAGKLMTERAIFMMIPQFRVYLQSVINDFTGKPLSDGTIIGYVACICNFYKQFYIEVPNLPRSRKRTVSKKENLKRPPKEDIKKVYDAANQRDKAIMLCGISSGMGAAEISSLTFEAFEEGYDPETMITTLDMRRGKVGKDFITFIGPEATVAVLDYLKWRDRPPAGPGKLKIIEREKRRVTKDSYLFISEKVNKQYLVSGNEKLRKLRSNAIVAIYNRLNDTTGMGSGRGVYNPIRSHNMRKHFITTLRNEGCDGDLVRYFVGHTLGGSEDTYYMGDPEKLKKIYSEFVPFLSIETEFDLSDSPEYKRMVHDNKILAEVTADQVVKLSEMDQIKLKLAEMEKRQALTDEMWATVSDDPDTMAAIMKRVSDKKQ